MFTPTNQKFELTLQHMVESQFKGNKKNILMSWQILELFGTFGEMKMKHHFFLPPEDDHVVLEIRLRIFNLKDFVGGIKILLHDYMDYTAQLRTSSIPPLDNARVWVSLFSLANCWICEQS